jgi:hypothetical protein
MSIEAMKQALDLLEVCNGAEIVEGVIIYTDKEITALRQAIEQAEKQEPVAGKRLELVGHADLGINNIYIFNDYGEEVPEGRTPIYAGYTTPQPQREWVGLTQEDIDIAFDDTQEGGGFNEFARAIEQTLKRKNT